MTVNANQQAYESQYGKITDQGLAELRSRIGQPLRAQEFGPPIPVASEESVKLWAWGIGDDNPLYTSTEHGRHSRWGAMLAPPSILFAMDPYRLGYMGGLPGVHALFAGINWEWQRPIRLGEQIESKAYLASVEERSNSKFSGRAVKQITETEFSRKSDGSPVGHFQHVLTRHERAEARTRGSYQRTDEDIPHHFSDEELQEIAEQYRRESELRRGTKARYWEDVSEGDEIGPIVKGPMTVTGIVAFTMAVRPVHLTRAHRLLFQLFDRHPGTAIPNYYNVPEPPISVHWSPDHAQLSGLPTAYDFGMERGCWAGHLFTDWMGDDAFLKALTVTFRAPNYFGDVTWFRAKVAEKFKAGNLHLVRCEYAGTNQRGQDNTAGQALVALPSSVQGGPDEEDLAAMTDGLSLLRR